MLDIRQEFQQASRSTVLINIIGKETHLLGFYDHAAAQIAIMHAP